MSWPWLTFLGLGAGSLGAAVGAGGGVVLAPLLLILTDLEPPIVAGTSLALVALNGVTSSPAYLKRGLVDRRAGVIFGLAAIPGSVVAPFVVEAVAGGIFRVLLALLVLALAVRLFFNRSDEAEQAGPRPLLRVGVVKRRIEAENDQVFEYEYSEPLAAAFNVALGFVSAFFGTGGGYVRTPVLVEGFRFPVRVAVATSMFAMAFYAAAGAAVHAYLANVNWAMALWMGIGTVVGGQVGAKAAATVRAGWIIKLLALMLAAIGLRLLVQGVFQS